MKSMSCIVGAAVVMTAAVTALVPQSAAAATNYCGELKNAYGPFDYRARAEHSNFELVENAHFTADVENGIRGISSTIGGDLDYTLRAIPNHHRALAAMARIAIRTKSIQLQGARYPVECWFERATRFAPDDGGVKAEFGNYLFALGKTDQAFAMFKEAAEMSPENATFNYNLGLAYAQKKDYAEALVYAKKAYDLGFPLPGLKKKLIDAGKWVEPSKEQPALAEPSDKPAG
jgi:tetratricopeptide (TPR) repeat protein